MEPAGKFIEKLRCINHTVQTPGKRIEATCTADSSSVSYNWTVISKSLFFGGSKSIDV